MGEDKLKEWDRELQQRAINNGEETICIGVIFIVMLLIAGYGVLTYHESVPVNMTGHVLDKKIVWDDHSVVHENRYFIFTEDYCFDVDLHTYNLLDKGDVVNLTDYHGVTLDIGNHRFMAE